MYKQMTEKEQVAGMSRESDETWTAVEAFFNSNMTDKDKEILTDRLVAIHEIQQEIYSREVYPRPIAYDIDRDKDYA